MTLMYRVVGQGNYTPEQKREFVHLIERAMKSGKYKGFGEIGLYHEPTVRRKGLTIKADHPWMLIRSDIVAKNDAVIDIHMEATDETIPALERLLAHNRNAKIVWAHSGWSVLGMATANVWERLMARHPNLYGSIKHRKLGRPNRQASEAVAIRDVKGRIRPQWLRLFDKFPGRFMIGSDIKPGTRLRKGSDFRHIRYTQEFLRELPDPLRRPITKGNAIKVFNLSR